MPPPPCLIFRKERELPPRPCLEFWDREGAANGANFIWILGREGKVAGGRRLVSIFERRREQPAMLP